MAEAQHLMEGLDWQDAFKDIRASVYWLKANGSSKVIILNFFFRYTLKPDIPPKLLHIVASNEKHSCEI